jgi:hypothetical protein
LTDNEYDDVTPLVSGDNLIWRGFDGNDWEIYQRIGSSTTALTDNAQNDGDYPDLASTSAAPFISRMSVSGDHVAWCGDDGNDYELFVYDGLTTTQVTHNNVEDDVGGISDGRAAFISDSGGASRDIYLFNGTTVQHIANASLAAPPSISGNVIAWHSGTDFNHLEIFVYDGTEVRQVSDTGSAAGPFVSGGRVVWGAEGGENKSLFNYEVDLQITSLLVVVPHYNSSVLSLTGDHVLYRSPEDGDRELFVYDFATQQSNQLTDNDRDDLGAAMHGDFVVWESFDGNDWEIILHDLVTGQSAQLTDNLVDDRNPGLSNSMIVWQTFDGNDWEIYQYAPPPFFLSITRNTDETVTVRWTNGGILESASRLDGVYQSLPDATSPYTVKAEEKQFFRLAR